MGRDGWHGTHGQRNRFVIVAVVAAVAPPPWHARIYFDPFGEQFVGPMFATLSHSFYPSLPPSFMLSPRPAGLPKGLEI